MLSSRSNEERRPRPARFTLLALLGLILCAIPPTQARADANTYAGTIKGKAGCTYSVMLDTDAKTFQGTVACKNPKTGFTLDGAYDGRSATLGTVTAQVAGNDLPAIDLDQTFTLPEGVDQPAAFVADLASQAGQTAGGQGSTDGASGSHGGKGGVGRTEAKAGSNYDSMTAPSLPGAGGGSDSGNARSGAPGGGVLFITASTARIDGGLYANGMTSNGPMRNDPYRHLFDSAGAGGTLNLTFDTLTGSGAIAANGGDACLVAAHLLDPNAACVGGGQGAGGGGRVAITYHAISGWHGTSTANSGGNQLDGTPGERGGTGTIYRHRAS